MEEHRIVDFVDSRLDAAMTLKDKVAKLIDAQNEIDRSVNLVGCYEFKQVVFDNVKGVHPDDSRHRMQVLLSFAKNIDELIEDIESIPESKQNSIHQNVSNIDCILEMMQNAYSELRQETIQISRSLSGFLNHSAKIMTDCSNIASAITTTL